MMQSRYYEYLGFVNLYYLQHVNTTVRNSGSTDATITKVEYSNNVYPEPIKIPISIPSNQSIEVSAYINPVYPYDNTNEYIKLSGYYLDTSNIQQPFEIIIYYQYTGNLTGKVLRFDLKNLPYFKDNLTVIIEYIPKDYTSTFSAPNLVLLKYGKKDVYELGKIYPITKYVYAYIFNNNKLKDEYDPLKTANMLLISNENSYNVKIKRIIYRGI